MKRSILAFAAAAMFVVGAAQAEEKKGNPMVVLETSEGKIVVELYPDKAPGTVQNFLWYIDNNFYDDLAFHRVIETFMIQGGGFSPEMTQKAGNPPIDNEAGNGLTNDKYTIAMARTNAVHSATSQFFINTKDNDFLNHRDNTPQGFGYCVFGKVVEGTDTVDAIASVPTGTKGQFQDVPKTPVLIKTAYRKDAKGDKPKSASKSE